MGAGTTGSPAGDGPGCTLFPDRKILASFSNTLKDSFDRLFSWSYRADTIAWYNLGTL